MTRIEFTSKTTNKGAFVELEEGVGGWVYTGELGEEDILNYREGDAARVVVLELDVEEECIVLSVKASGDKKGVGS